MVFWKPINNSSGELDVQIERATFHLHSLRKNLEDLYEGLLTVEYELSELIDHLGHLRYQAKVVSIREYKVLTRTKKSLISDQDAFTEQISDTSAGIELTEKLINKLKDQKKILDSKIIDFRFKDEK
jgi:chromosome segregation ATPase